MNFKPTFTNQKLFDQALTHRSWVNENKGKRPSNERLEYLGDAVLEFIVTSELFKRFPNQPEGYLTALRANLVNTTNLASIASKMNLGELIFLSKGEEEGGGRTNPSLLADTVEAVIGAIYLDQGLEAAQNFIQQNLLADLEEKLKEPLKDAKSRLQEAVQAKGWPAPKYEVINQTGPDHAKEFEVQVQITNQEGKVKTTARGKGGNKATGQQEAATQALAILAKER
jgi:ribonuclease-3